MSVMIPFPPSSMKLAPWYVLPSELIPHPARDGRVTEQLSLKMLKMCIDLCLHLLQS